MPSVVRTATSLLAWVGHKSAAAAATLMFAFLWGSLSFAQELPATLSVLADHGSYEELDQEIQVGLRDSRLSVEDLMSQILKERNRRPLDPDVLRVLYTNYMRATAKVDSAVIAGKALSTSSMDVWASETADPRSLL